MMEEVVMAMAGGNKRWSNTEPEEEESGSEQYWSHCDKARPPGIFCVRN